ncbi:MAG: LytTR family DNA-binding domain-containing protein, partial [Bacteroidota bacterium]
FTLGKVKYKKRFVVKKGHNILAVNSEDILYFFSENKTTWLMHKQGKKYHLELTLEQLLEKIDPANFFRINRKYILAFSSIQNITAYSGNRLKVNLKHAVEEEVLVSRERVGTFKQWLDQ